jgi:transmembrane sensor
VERGRVRVSWPGGEVLLGVGEAGDYPPPQASNSPSPEESAVPVEALNLEPPSAEAPSPEAHVWRDYAHRGEYAKAFAALRRTPNDVREEPADLLLAADVARLSSHPAQAVAPLRRVCERYSKDSHAPVAAFTLGRVLLDDLGRAGEAASAFDLAARLWPSGPLASDAMAREAEALKRAGQLPEAQAVARKYLALHPGGRHAASLRAMLDAE